MECIAVTDPRPFNDDFHARWLSETVRLHEQACGRLGDADVVQRVRRERSDAEGRIMARARLLGDRHGLAEALASWRTRSRVVVAIAAVLALLVGVGAALAVVGDGQRAINVLWALGSLLGVHLFSLVLWLGGMGYAMPRAGGALGQSWLWLLRRLPGGGPSRFAGEALIGLYARHGLMRWWLGMLTHGLWLLAFAGALLGLLAALSLRSYGFVWETTILPGETFVSVVAALGWLPAQLGFAVPDAAAVRASGDAAVMLPDVRQAWASWLVGCVLLYGLAPRLLLLLLCTQRLRAGQRRVHLDLSLPGYALLVERLSPASERMGVTDAAPERIEHAHYGGEHAVATGGAVIVGVELREVFDWPPPLGGAAYDAGVLESRAQRQALCAALASAPPARLLVVCDARLSPDRGSLNLIAELAALAGAYAVWLAVPPGKSEDPVRLQHWHERLDEFGLEVGPRFSEQGPALAWLRGESDE